MASLRQWHFRKGSKKTNHIDTQRKQQVKVLSQKKGMYVRKRGKACGVVGRDESKGRVVADEVGRYGGGT